jgi:hypothetical protein
MSRLAAGLEAAAALAAGAALAAAAFGPFQLELFGASVSVRTLSRPVHLHPRPRPPSLARSRTRPAGSRSAR